MKSKTTKHRTMVHPFLPARSEAMAIDGQRELSLELYPVTDGPRLEAPASWRFAAPAADGFEVTSRYLCRVPVANDVKRCICGGVYSQRLDGANFCRGCGRD